MKFNITLITFEVWNTAHQEEEPNHATVLMQDAGEFIKCQRAEGIVISVADVNNYEFDPQDFEEIQDLKTRLHEALEKVEEYEDKMDNIYNKLDDALNELQDASDYIRYAQDDSVY